MEEEKVVTLLAEEGKKFAETGEAIGSYGRCLVFLPKGATPGKNVRVRLQEIKEDSRGRMMYRGIPAPVEFTERWRDNGNGTASRVKIAIDWLLQEVEAGVIETRALGRRETHCVDRLAMKVSWGKDQASTFVEKAEVKVFYLETEQIQAGQIVWKKTGEREEVGTPERLPVVKARVWGGDLESKKLEVAYQDTWTLTVDCHYTDSDFVRENSVWGKMPTWVQAEAQTQYPVCVCSRKRVAPQPDGYLKCEACRKEEVCVRCGKKSSVKNLAGRLVCDKCQPYESAERLIETTLPRESREAIAVEAKKLLAGQSLPQEAGEAVLKATSDHLTDSWQKRNLLAKWSGFGWYYFCGDGIYGAKFAPAALQLLQFLPQATGNGLVELVAWLTEGPQGQYYLRTQVKGESGVALPQITSDLAVAARLRGSEADRISSLAGYQALVERLGKESDEAKAVAEILQAEKQDYAAALRKLGEVKKRRQAEPSVEVNNVEDPDDSANGSYNTMALAFKKAMEKNKEKKGEKKEKCPHCWGRGESNGNSCWYCEGSGIAPKVIQKYGDRRGAWTPEEKDAELAEFGEVLLESLKYDEPLPADRDLAVILGWDFGGGPLQGDQGDPYGLRGLVRQDCGEVLAVFLYIKNLAIGKDYTYLAGRILSPEEESAVRNWIAGKK